MNLDLLLINRIKGTVYQHATNPYSAENTRDFRHLIVGYVNDTCERLRAEIKKSSIARIRLTVLSIRSILPQVPKLSNTAVHFLKNINLIIGPLITPNSL